MTKYVYLFNEGNGKMRELLGGKGANLAEMMNLGLPVPDGFTVTTEACNKYYEDGKTLSEEVREQIFQALEKTEKKLGKKLGDVKNPLLVSVRSGARASMPGMMDTILNLGLNDETVEGLATLTSNPRFAYDSYRRFIQMFSDVVMEISKDNYEKLLEKAKQAKGVTLDTELDANDLKKLVVEFKQTYKKLKGEEFPQDPKEQLIQAVLAVFRSWDNPRAIYYRRMNDIPSDWGTAVNVQSMVFGNMGEDLRNGRCLYAQSRNGRKAAVRRVSDERAGRGRRGGYPYSSIIAQLRKAEPRRFTKQFARHLQNRWKTITGICRTWSSQSKDGKLYMLQTRNGKRTAAAALKIAIDLVEEGMISTKKEAVLADRAKAA